MVRVTKIGVRRVGGGALAVNGEDGVASAGLQIQLVAAHLPIAHALVDHLGLKSIRCEFEGLGENLEHKVSCDKVKHMEFIPDYSKIPTMHLSSWTRASTRSLIR